MTRRPQVDVGARIDEVAAVYRAAREEARRRSSWRLRFREWRWRKALAANGVTGLDALDQARLAALRAELQARALGDVPPWPGLP